MLIVNMFKYNNENSICDFYNIIYLITHSVLLVFVIISICITGKIFWVTLKLNTEKDYFNEELERYINEKAIDLERRANNKNNKSTKKKKLNLGNF